MCEKGCLCCSVVGGIISGIIIIIVLIATSIAKLEPYEVGLQYNPNSVTINQGRLYTSGTYFLCPGCKFIKFNKQMRTIQFGNQLQSSSSPDVSESSIVCRTNDALLAEIEVSFQYQLSSDLADILEIYSDWGEDYEDAFVMIAENQIRDSFAMFGALAVFYNRSTIETQMLADMQTKFNSMNI
jgi:regulator of protease activity HflC (stomatin/prohibitin superfamily)